MIRAWLLLPLLAVVACAQPKAAPQTKPQAPARVAVPLPHEQAPAPDKAIQEFLEQLEKEGLSPTTPEARARAEQFRSTAGLLPDEILREMYLEFWFVQSQIRAKRAGGDIYVPYVPYTVWPQTLDFRHAGRTNLRFEHNYLAHVQFPPQLATAPVVDMASSNWATLEGLIIRPDEAYTPPGCGILLGRSAAMAGSGGVIVRHCKIRGRYGDANPYGGACVVNIGCEVYRITDASYFRFSGKKGGAFYTSAYNDYRITSPHGPIAGGFTPGASEAVSNAGGVIDGSCFFACDLAPPGSDPAERYVFKLGSRTHSLWIRDVYVSAKTAGGLDAVFVLGDSGDNEVLGGGTNNIQISCLHDEAWAARTFIRLDGSTRGVTFADISFVQSGRLVDYGHRHNFRFVDGLHLVRVAHRPHPTYWP